MDAEQTFQKALLVLSQLGDFERGESLLNEAIILAYSSGEIDVKVRAKVALAELLCDLKRKNECK